MANQPQHFQIEPYRIISAKRLANTIAEGRAHKERFCFILGSGASVESGIKVGTQLEKQWMDEMNRSPGFREVCRNAAALKAVGKLEYDFEADILPRWQNGERLGSEYYFDIYTLRFFPNHRNGYFCFEEMIAKAKPSFGYNALAQILADGQGSNLVITTNFDSLAEDALFIYTDKKPLVINHELLADYAEDANITQPIIAKVHRGLFFDPLNRKEETEKLKGSWSEVLRSIFHVYTPVVIGYGGGDKSLMDLLEEKDVRMKNGIYWCYRERDGMPDERIQRLVEAKNGCLVKTAGFDAVMLSLGNVLAPEKIEPQTVSVYLKKQHDSRVSWYETQYNKLMKDAAGAELAPGAFIADASGSGRIETEKRDRESESEFKEAARELDKRVETVENSKPENELTAQDYVRRGDRAYADGLYETAVAELSKAIALDANNEYAYFSRGLVYDDLENYEEALADFGKAIELNPHSSVNYERRAMIYKHLSAYQQALADFDTAIALNAEDADLYTGRGDVYKALGQFDKALSDFSKAIELNPNDWFAYDSRADIYELSGAPESAKADREKSNALFIRFMES